MNGCTCIDNQKIAGTPQVRTESALIRNSISPAYLILIGHEDFDSSLLNEFRVGRLR